MRDRIQALLESGAAEQIVELGHTLRGEALAPWEVRIIREICQPGDGIEHFLVDDEDARPHLRVQIVAAALRRFAEHNDTSPPAAWLARHAAREALRDDFLHEGTATLMRQHLPHTERYAVDMISEDRADWQRASDDHRAALVRLTAAWFADRLGL